jgi:hypothetical protein
MAISSAADALLPHDGPHKDRSPHLPAGTLAIPDLVPNYFLPLPPGELARVGGGIDARIHGFDIVGGNATKAGPGGCRAVLTR